MPSPGERWALAIVAYEPLGLVAEPAHSTVAGSRAGSSPTKAELRAENARLREEVARLQVQLHELGGMPDATERPSSRSSTPSRNVQADGADAVSAQ